MQILFKSFAGEAYPTGLGGQNRHPRTPRQRSRISLPLLVGKLTSVVLPFAIIAGCFLGHKSYAESLQQNVVNREDGSPIHYFLKEANPAARMKILLIVLQGSSCESVVNISSIWKKYALLIPRADVVAIEKYGIPPGFSAATTGGKCPNAYLERDSLTQRYQDLLTVLNDVRAGSYYTNTVVFGGSEGGSLAMLSAYNGAPIDSSIAFNAGGRWFVDDVLHSIKVSIPDESARSEAIKGLEEFIESLNSEHGTTKALSNHGIRWWQSMLSNDQQRNLVEAKLPVLVIQSGLDTNVSPVEWLAMRDQVMNTENEFVSFAFFPDLDHGLRNSGGVDNTEIVLSRVRSWLTGL